MRVHREKLIEKLDEAIDNGEIDENEARAILRDYDYEHGYNLDDHIQLTQQ